MTELWLVRHGQTDWNLAGRWQGQATDAPGLNKTGRKQARAAFCHLPNIPFAAVYTSDLLRARQTARFLAAPLKIPIILEPRLREINLGLWEGRMFTDIQAGYAVQLEQRARDPFHTAAPNGESPQDVARRVLAAVDEISQQHPDQAVILVSHGVSLAVITCRAGGLPLEVVYDQLPENASPLRVSWPPPID
jgi:broad specificity phosphatase PhoE